MTTTNTTKTTMTTLTGYAAIEYAEAHGLTLSKYNDPTEPARDGLTVDDAREVAEEDPSLIHLTLYAAVGSDGTRPVVWGVGSNADEARDDARGWLAEAGREHEANTLETHPITVAQHEAIRDGAIAWPVRA